MTKEQMIVVELAKNSSRARDVITNAMNDAKLPANEGIFGLLTLGTSHAKLSNFTKEEFLGICETLYEAIDGVSDVVEERYPKGLN